MDTDRSSDVDRYLDSLFIGDDPALEATLRSTTENGMPTIQVSPTQGKFLNLLVRMSGARKVLELGTLAGYSTIWLARALPSDGRLISLEASAEFAAVARRNVDGAGLSGVVEIRIGPAIESLPVLESESAGPFDLIFIDADKVGYPAYLDWAMRLSRPGTVIVADNVVRDGEVLDPDSADEGVPAIRAFNEQLGADERLDATVLQVVGAKGWDGIAFAVVR